MLIVISNNESIKNEITHFEKLFTEGADFLHLRKPSLSESDLENFIKTIPADLRNKISLHNHFDLAEKYNFGGIHFTSATKHLLNNFSGSRFRISVSSHSFDEINELPQFVDYTFLSPVFDSISKENYPGKFNSEKTEKFLKNKFPFDIIALGGVSEKNIKTVSDLGFQGAALFGTVWNNNNYEIPLREIKKYV